MHLTFWTLQINYIKDHSCVLVTGKSDSHHSGKLHSKQDHEACSAEINSTIIWIFVCLQVFECHNIVFEEYSDVIIVQLTCVPDYGEIKAARSHVWEFFEATGEKKVQRKLCTPPNSTTLVYHGETTSMQSHLMSQHPDKYVYTSVHKSGKDSKSQHKIDQFNYSMFDH